MKKRRQKNQKLSSKKILFIDRIVILVAVVYPLTAIPQILEIWVEKNTQGVSLLTWSLFFILQSVLLVYGIVHKDRKLTLMWGLWIFVYIIIISGLLLYQ